MRDLIRVEQVSVNSTGNMVSLNLNAQTTSGGGAVPFNALLLQAVGIVGNGATPEIVIANGDIADGVSPVGTGGTSGFGGMVTLARNTIFNGATWDRLRGVAIGDGAAATGIAAEMGFLWNGATYDRRYSASAANLGAQSGKGAALVTLPGNWTIFNAPAVGNQATATKAGVAGVRHVLTSINASINATAAQTPLSVVVRDGASGVGAILWQDRLSAPATPFADSRVSLSGLNIVGTAGNAMTVEFTAAGAGTTFETVSATGYDAS